MANKNTPPIGPRRFLAVAIMAACSGNALAVQLDDGSGDFTVRWDNTVKYNAMGRVEDQDQDVTASKSPSLFDDADLGYDTGVVSSRFDLLSEFDVVWKQRFGFRVSAAGWYDFAYGDDNDHPGVNKDFLVNGNYTDTWGFLSVPPGEMNDFGEDQSFKDAELLDAFVFANFVVGSGEASIRAGRHTIYWGQSLFGTGATVGIAGAMAPIDQAKGLGVPGSEAKELFLPTNKLSGSFQASQNLTLVAYYSFEWEPTRYPAPGSYFALSEISMDDAEYLTLQPGQVAPATGALVAPRTGLVQNQSEKPEEGEWGAGLQYAFENGLELGAYFLSYHDKAPQGITGVIDYGQFVSSSIYKAAPGFVSLIPLFWPSGVQYNVYDEYTGGGYPAHGVGRFKWTYREDNELFGISLAKEIAGVSFGMDLVYRHDVAIDFNSATLLNVENYATLSGPALVTGAQAQIDAALTALGANLTAPFDFVGADGDNYPGATGDVASLVLNGVGFLNPGALWDGGQYGFEFTATALLDYGDNEQLASKYIDEDDLATTIALSVGPQWYQVMPSTDLKMPISLSYGINGHSPLRGGGDQSLGIASVGLQLEYEQVWLIDAKYNVFFGDQDRGSLGNLIDRDNVSLTIKRTF